MSYLDTIVTDTQPDIMDWHAHQPLDATLEFCRRHGEEPSDVAGIAYDNGKLRFDIILKRDGKPYLGCAHGDGMSLFMDGHDGECFAATAPREHALVGALPDWWQPATACPVHGNTAA